tara:strand:+ start:4138 stop:4761 length:624 start_codon:yes stop_codon:yes gene_type:complete
MSNLPNPNDNNNVKEYNISTINNDKRLDNNDKKLVNNDKNLDNNISSKNEDEINQSNLENLLLNLQIISNIKEYDKLSIISERLSIDRPTIFQGLWRKFNGDGRTETLDSISNLIETIFRYTDTLLEKENKNKYKISCRLDDNITFSDETSKIFSDIMINLDNCIKGLQNLKITYLSDISINSQLNFLISKISNRVDKIKKILVIKK